MFIGEFHGCHSFERCRCRLNRALPVIVLQDGIFAAILLYGCGLADRGLSRLLDLFPGLLGFPARMRRFHVVIDLARDIGPAKPAGRERQLTRTGGEQVREIPKPLAGTGQHLSDPRKRRAALALAGAVH